VHSGKVRPNGYDNEKAASKLLFFGHAAHAGFAESLEQTCSECTQTKTDMGRDKAQGGGGVVT